MAKRTKLTAAQTQALYDDFLQGLSRDSILKKYNISVGQYRYWTTKLSGKDIGFDSNSNNHIQIIPGKKARECGKCKKMFRPYTLRFCECYRLCPFCYTKGEYEYDAEDFDEMEC